MLEHYPKLKKVANKYGMESQEFVELLAKTLNKSFRQAILKKEVTYTDIMDLVEFSVNHCDTCGKKVIPDLKAVNNKGEWDGHTFRHTCKCHNSNLRISSG